MLTPTKHAHPDRTTINAALIILKRLMHLRIDHYSDLLSYTKKQVSGGSVLFLPALNFLYLMGLIEYHPKTDSFEYIQNNEII